MKNLDGNFNNLTETGLLDKDKETGKLTGIEKFPITTTIPVVDGETVTLTVDGKIRTAKIWIRARESKSDTYLPEIAKGEIITWMHLLPEVKVHKFITANQPAI